MRVPILDQIWGLIVGEEEPQLEVLFVLAQRFGPSARRRLLESMPRLIEARHKPLVFAALTNELADLGAETDVPIRQMARQIAPKLLEAAGRTRDRDLTYTILGDALVAEEILRSDMPPAFEPAGLKVRSELLDCVQRYPHADRLQTLCGRLSDGEQVTLADLVTSYFVDQGAAAAPRPIATSAPNRSPAGIVLKGGGRPKHGGQRPPLRPPPEMGGKSEAAAGEKPPGPSKSLARLRLRPTKRGKT